MSIKTILVHLDNPARASKVLDPAMTLAAAQGAHVVGLHVMPSLAALPGYGYELPGAVIDTFDRNNAARAAKLREAFDHALSSVVGVNGSWAQMQSLGSDPASEVLEHARCSDLVVVLQADEAEGATRWELGGRLVLESGRPVLMVPHSGKFPTIGKRVLVAWNGSRECARAVFDALPVMQKADEVRILGVGGRANPEGVDLPGAELAATLARHGLRVVTETGKKTPLSVADELLNVASDTGADLLVMGGYGHSRAREFLFGGVTREIMGHMTVPVLFSH